jgi:hypothetical protein
VAQIPHGDDPPTFYDGCMSPGFRATQWPRRYTFTIEECVAAGGVLTVADATAILPPVKRRRLVEWASPLGLRLVARRMGASRRWCFQCPSCQRRCEALYRPPSEPDATWACRICAGVTYASRLYGRRHPARQIPTPRQAIIARRRDAAERRLLNAWAASDPWWASRRERLREELVRATASRDARARDAAAWLRQRVTRMSAALGRPSADVIETLRRLNLTEPTAQH